MADVPTYNAFGDRTGPFKPFLPALCESFTPLSGHGSPEGIVAGVPPQTYLDLDTASLYMKLAGTQTLGWSVVGSVGQNINTILRSTVDPTGVIEATGAAMVLGDGPLTGKVWVKSTPGTSNSQWALLIA